MDIFADEAVKKIKQAKHDWESTTLEKDLEQRKEQKKEFKTKSGLTVKRLYSPIDLKERDWDYLKDSGFPGEYPFARGEIPAMYRNVPPRPFTYQGFGSAEETNERFKYMLSQGARRVAIAPDLPTQLGYDSDHPLARGQVGKVGVPINSLVDMETIFDGIPLDKVSVGSQGNADACILVAAVMACAEKTGIPPEKVNFFIQNEILKEYFARGAYIFPPKPSLKFACDLIEYAAREKLSGIVPIQYCGYHVREAGGDAIQEITFLLADAAAYIEEVLSRGVKVDELPMPQAVVTVGMDIFEEVCKLRALRRMWARMMKERFKATNPLVLGLFLHTGCQASVWTAQQPMNNIVRGTVVAIAEMLAGSGSLGIASMTEALSIPTVESATLNMRTLQIVSEETGLQNTVDPLGGSYYVEALTDEIEERATKLLEKIEKLGGVVACIDKGFQERLIGESAYEQMRQIKSGEMVHVGVNKYRTDEPIKMNLMKVDPKEEERQIEKVKRLRRERDNEKVEAALKGLKEAALEGVNLFPSVLDAVKAYATGGEICDTLRSVYGEYKRPAY